MPRWKSMPNATAANNLARAMGQAHAAQTGKPHPIPPQFYGAGRQPSPLSSTYLEYFVRPIAHLIPASDEAIAQGGGQMNGHQDSTELTQEERDLLNVDNPGQLSALVAPGKRKR